MLSDAVDAPRSLEQYAEDLRRMARARLERPLRGRLRVSDLVQQTLLIAFQKQNQFRGATHGRLRRWLRAILKRQLAQAARRFSDCPPERARSIECMAELSTPQAGAGLAARDSAIARRAAREERWRVLSAAIATLPDDQRLALELRYFQGRSVVEIADRMDRTTASITGLLYRALKSLREVLT